MRSIALVLCLYALAACSEHGDGAAKTADAAARERKTVLDEQMKALEKAKAVQRTVDEAAEAQRKAIDDAGG